MAQILDCLKASINSKFIPNNQKWMSESFRINGVPKEMKCEICSEKRGQEWLLVSFDLKGNNKELFPYFNENPGLVSMCDYFVFIEQSQRLTVVAVELKHHLDSPETQIYVNIPFARFIIERIKEISPKIFKDVVIQYRGIGVKQSYKSKPFTKGYSLSYNEKDYALLPNPKKMYLTLVCNS